MDFIKHIADLAGNVTTPNECGYYPIDFCTTVEQAKFLVERGADITRPDKRRESTTFRQTEKLWHILIDKRDIPGKEKKINDHIALIEFAVSQGDAIERKYAEIFKRVIKKGMEELNEADKAIANAALEKIQVSLEKAVVNSQKNAPKPDAPGATPN